MVVQVLAIALELIIDDLRRTLVTLDAFAREHLHVDHRARNPRRHAKRGVLHVGRLLAKDRAQQFLFRCELCLALGGDLADQHVPGLDFGTDVDNAGVVETAKLRFSEARNITRDFLGA